MLSTTPKRTRPLLAAAAFNFCLLLLHGPIHLAISIESGGQCDGLVHLGRGTFLVVVVVVTFPVRHIRRVYYNNPHVSLSCSSLSSFFCFVSSSLLLFYCPTTVGQLTFIRSFHESLKHAGTIPPVPRGCLVSAPEAQLSLFVIV